MFQRDDEFDTSQTYLCIVPGLEGFHLRFHELCERLKLPAVVLQPGVNKPHESIRDLAQRYVNNLLNKMEIKNKFYLLGYECGILVALEMAAILEEIGNFFYLYIALGINFANHRHKKWSKG